jgi:hypothetical protein
MFNEIGKKIPLNINSCRVQDLSLSSDVMHRREANGSELGPIEASRRFRNIEYNFDNEMKIKF